jgi:hypothetical protein
MDLQEVGEGREDWMELAQDRDRWRALLRRIFRKMERVVRTGWSWLRIGIGGGLY